MVEQTVKVYLRAPRETVVYEFTESRKLPMTFENAHVVVTVNLPPHGGRMLCLYPEELKAIGFHTEGPYSRGATGWIEATVVDARNQPIKGRQLFEVKILDPSGKEHDESGLYRVVDGKARLPFRPALNDAGGPWRMELRERTSGLVAEVTVLVK